MVENLSQTPHHTQADGLALWLWKIQPSQALVETLRAYLRLLRVVHLHSPLAQIQHYMVRTKKSL